MALYLCKMDPNTSGEPRFIAMLGHVIRVNEYGGEQVNSNDSTPRDFYQFVPHVSGRTRSRKVWSSVTDCLPAWTERHGFLSLLDTDDLKRAQSNANQ